MEIIKVKPNSVVWNKLIAYAECCSWDYLCWVRKHPVDWKAPTRILYADKDYLTPREVMERFADASGSLLTVMENGEHWFHTEEQLRFLRDWEAEVMIRHIRKLHIR